MSDQQAGNESCMPAAHEESDQGLTPELIGIILAVLVLAVLVGVLITVGA